jgi:hypothetical protein
MNQGQEELEQRVTMLEQQVATLKSTVDSLQQSATSVSSSSKQIKTSKKLVNTSDSEEILSWVDKSAILPRVATTSFILAISLALRTAADSGALDIQLGSIIGMLFAFGLLIYSWFSYQKNSIHAPVFILWGTIVMCAVVVEAHRGFSTIPTEVAYFAMAVTGGLATIISRRFRVALPVFAGTLGMSIGAFALDYPSPVFPYLAVIMIFANIFAAYASHILRASWLRWLLLALTIFMFQIWDMKLTIYLGRLSLDNLDFSIRGFLPSAGLICTTFSVIALLGIRGIIQDKVSKFDLSLPVINVFWLYLIGQYAFSKQMIEPLAFGWLAMLGAFAHLGVAWWLAHHEEGGSTGTTTFAISGGLLFAFSAPMALGHDLIATALVAIMAVSMIIISGRINNYGLRLTSYLLQIYACTTLVFILRTTEGTHPSLIGAVSSGLLATIAFYHYSWARKHPPITESSTYNLLNKNDRGASILLIAAFFSAFFTLRVGLYQILDILHTATPRIFAASQSVLINASAAGLLLFSLYRHNKELRNVAIIITIIGAAKVFLLDMVQLKGVPLLFSVFSFGLVAALASFVLGRWGKATKAEDL